MQATSSYAPAPSPIVSVTALGQSLLLVAAHEDKTKLALAETGKALKQSRTSGSSPLHCMKQTDRLDLLHFFPRDLTTYLRDEFVTQQVETKNGFQRGRLGRQIELLSYDESPSINRQSDRLHLRWCGLPGQIATKAFTLEGEGFIGEFQSLTKPSSRSTGNFPICFECLKYKYKKRGRGNLDFDGSQFNRFAPILYLSKVKVKRRNSYSNYRSRVPDCLTAEMPLQSIAQGPMASRVERIPRAFPEKVLLFGFKLWLRLRNDLPD
ncbi:unnamed protein product [Sphenostylis stenocarpa]|uniref:Uncharacterized protein n=1 Tax=Sphenostylis stenocarpa TaxID=92480 RepID=A0AA86ST47_9FABA|nr:unnamed protein product [Sphenostylis stenocarpa]